MKLDIKEFDRIGYQLNGYKIKSLDFPFLYTELKECENNFENIIHFEYKDRDGLNILELIEDEEGYSVWLNESQIPYSDEIRDIVNTFLSVLSRVNKKEFLK